MSGDLDKFCRTLELALKLSAAPKLPYPFNELAAIPRALAWKGVNFAAAALLGPPPFTEVDDAA